MTYTVASDCSWYVNCLLAQSGWGAHFLVHHSHVQMKGLSKELLRKGERPYPSTVSVVIREVKRLEGIVFLEFA